MNVIKAAFATHELLDKLILDNGTIVIPHFHNPEYGLLHASEMLHKIETEQIKGEQAHRWLGWAQCSVCISGLASLKQLKEINHGS